MRMAVVLTKVLLKRDRAPREYRQAHDHKRIPFPFEQRGGRRGPPG